MIAFGCAVTDQEAYERWAAPGIERARDEASVVLATRSEGSIFQAYNALLELAGEHEDLEALVLLHQDVEIVDPSFGEKVREALADPEVAVVGSVGAVDVRSMAWWEGTVTWASFAHRYPEYGGGEIRAFGMGGDDQTPPPHARTGEVDTLDGFIMVLAPWSVRNLHFDESIGRFHGYDFDFCQQVREAGKKVITADLKVIHHHSLDLLGDAEAWTEAYTRLIQKWEGRAPQIPSFNGDWKERAYRAEASAAAARTERVATQWQANAREAALRREIETMRASTSWRVTEPLRRLAQFARARRSLLRQSRQRRLFELWLLQ